MPEWTLADLKRLAAERPAQPRRPASVPPLPAPVRRKLAERREYAAVVGVCSGCDEYVIRTRDGVLRSTMVKWIGGGFSEKCKDDGSLHVLDPRRTFRTARFKVRVSARERGQSDDG